MAVSIPPENLLNNLEEVFCCYICLGRLRDTRLCPKCSKMCCFQCIRRWLIEQKPSCPHCRSSLLLHELVKCRWVDDLLPRLDNQARKEALSKDKCPIHSEQVDKQINMQINIQTNKQTNKQVNKQINIKQLILSCSSAFTV